VIFDRTKVIGEFENPQQVLRQELARAGKVVVGKKRIFPSWQKLAFG
jgi:hypothetical protein